MMKNLTMTIFSFLVIGLITFGGAGAAKAQKSDDVLKDFTAIYAEIDKLLVEKNLGVIESLIAPNFKAKRDGKEMSSEEYLKQTKEAMKALKDTTFAKSTIEDIDVGQDGAVTVKVTSEAKFIFVKDGKEVEVEVTSSSLDTWVKVEDDWLIVYTETIASK
jgi:hypothetical protein